MLRFRTCGLLAALLVCGCARPAPAPAPPQVRAQALIDSGNASFRAGDFPAAAKRYASAAVVRPDDPAAFYGLGMALSRLGRDDDARIAYARARELARAAGQAPPVAPAPPAPAPAGRPR
ncbi:MAG TPA: tetratricopeptide repeat protein [Candidatus Eisenbacteria bacterium]|nr:tetratricopeptide repeat protein [Candidatus Eisenbacteria bacterium]